MAIVLKGNQNVFNNLFGYNGDDSIREHISNNLKRINRDMGGISDNFIKESQALYDDNYNADEDRMIKVAMSKINKKIEGDFIIALNVNNFRKINDTMKPYIMSNVELNRLRMSESISGYDECYMERDSDLELEQRESYLEVNNGMNLTDKDGNDYCIMNFSDKELTLDEQCDILDAQELILDLLSEDIDATDIN